MITRSLLNTFVVGIALSITACVVDGKNNIGFRPLSVGSRESSMNVRDDSGTCGDLKWVYDANTSTLIINGTGEIPDYSSSSPAPWPSQAKKLILGEGVTSVGRNAFASNSLQEVVFSSTVTSIGDYAFCYNSIKNITFPSGLKSIGNHAFGQNMGLNSLYIPASVTFFGQGAFAVCTSVKSFTVDGDNPVYISIDGVVFNRGKWDLVQFPCGKSENYTIPDHTTTIHAYAFSGCMRVTSLVIPSSVTTIGEGAFSYLGYMPSITLPPSITYIDSYAFATCGDLTSITIPANVKYFGERVFDDCVGLSSMTFLGSVAPQCLEDSLFTEKIKHFCIPVDYDSSSLCNLNISFNKTAFEYLLEQNNNCFEAIMCNDGNATVLMRENATEWENQISECFDYQCSNETGRVATDLCKETKGPHICMNGKCVDEEILNQNNVFAVEIFVEGKTSTELDMKKILQSVSNVSGIEIDHLQVGVEIDEQGQVIRILVLLEDEQSAQIVADSINSIDESQECYFSILCRTTSARIIMEESSLASITVSQSSRNHGLVLLVVIGLMLTLF